MKAIRNELFWVPKKFVEPRVLKNKFEIIVDEVAENEYYEDEEVTRIKLWKSKRIKGVPYIGVPFGQPHVVKACLKKRDLVQNYVDKTPLPKLDYLKDLEWNPEMQPYDYQKKAVKALLKAGNGVLESAPRTGKTVMGTMLTTKLCTKTWILAHQHTLLEQFLKTFHEFTDIQDLQARIGKPIIGICTKLSDFDKYDICLSTYQMFLPSNGGVKKLKHVRNMFGLVIVDEAHRESAFGYINVITNINSRHKFGLTGTPDRKDGMYVLTELTLGDVAHKTEAKSMVPKVYVHLTDHKNNCSTWVPATRNMTKDKKRNAMILDYIERDIKLGHNVVVPITFNNHGDEMVAALNKKFGEEIAVAYNGSVPKKKRKDILDAANRGEYKCMFARRDMLLGVNVPFWSAIHVIMPIANPPNFTQEIDRVCTPLEGKRDPIVRIYVDNMGLSRGCFAKCTQTFKQKGAKYSKKSYERMKIIYANLSNKVSPVEDEYARTKTVGAKKSLW